MLGFRSQQPLLCSGGNLGARPCSITAHDRGEKQSEQRTTTELASSHGKSWEKKPDEEDTRVTGDTEVQMSPLGSSTQHTAEVTQHPHVVEIFNPNLVGLYSAFYYLVPR